MTLRHLVLVLGDPLDLEAVAFDGYDATHDAVWMAEVPANPHMALQVKNVARLSDAQKQAIRARAAAVRRGEVGAEHDT